MKGMDAINRLSGGLSKIGIRPTIDGRRRGVREALEDQTMGMAKTLAAKAGSLVTRKASAHAFACQRTTASLLFWAHAFE